MTDVLFYPGNYDPLMEPATGKLIRVENGEALILYSMMEYRVPVNETREPWDPAWYQFWMSKGYYMSFWGFRLPVIAGFFLLVY